MSHQTLKEEIHRIKMLYRDIIDLDNGGVETGANLTVADKALDELIALAVAEERKRIVEMVNKKLDSEDDGTLIDRDYADFVINLITKEQ